MQNSFYVDAEASEVVPTALSGSPEGKRRGSCRRDWDIGDTCRLCSLTAMIHGIVITYCCGQLVNFVAIHLRGEWRKTLTDLALVKHVSAPLPPKGGTVTLNA